MIRLNLDHINEKGKHLIGPSPSSLTSLKQAPFQPSPKVNIHLTPTNGEVNQFLAKLKRTIGMLEQNEDFTKVETSFSNKQLDEIQNTFQSLNMSEPLDISKVIVLKKSLDKHYYKRSSHMDLLYKEPKDFIGNSYNGNSIAE